MADETIDLTLRVWRQDGPDAEGGFEIYEAEDISPHSSFLEMLDVVNEKLIHRGEEPIAFDSDCREGICGACGFVIDGQAHGPERATTVCQLHMRNFEDGQTITLEPWRSKAFPVIKDLIVDRQSFDNIIASGGYVSTGTGPKPDANAVKINKKVSDKAFDAAECISCGACVAACPNGSASLFTGAKVSHLSMLPQGKPEKDRRAVDMVHQMEEEGFGNCSNIGECEAVCPKEISIEYIAKMKRDYLFAMLKGEGGSKETEG